MQLSEADFQIWLKNATEEEKEIVIKAYTEDIEMLTQEIIKIAHRIIKIK